MLQGTPLHGHPTRLLQGRTLHWPLVFSTPGKTPAWPNFSEVVLVIGEILVLVRSPFQRVYGEEAAFQWIKKGNRLIRNMLRTARFKILQFLITSMKLAGQLEKRKYKYFENRTKWLNFINICLRDYVPAPPSRPAHQTLTRGGGHSPPSPTRLNSTPAGNIPPSKPQKGKSNRRTIRQQPPEP